MSEGYIDNKGNYVKPRRDKEELLIVALVNALAMLIADRVVAGLHFSGLISLLLAAVLFTALNLSIKPVLQIAALPLTVLTCGIFALILNGFMLWLVVWLIPGCTLASFGSAILGSIVISLANFLINWIIGRL
jgi:putative membrane protein